MLTNQNKALFIILTNQNKVLCIKKKQNSGNSDESVFQGQLNIFSNIQLINKNFASNIDGHMKNSPEKIKSVAS